MRVFEADNTNDMMEAVFPVLINEGILADSRNGGVLKFREPCTFVYRKPWQRVNLDPLRDCNPFFHLMEAIMMVGDHNCVSCMSKFTSQMAQYSDDGKTFNAFYGTRMHEHDQFNNVVTLLNDDLTTRQAVIDLWRPSDLTAVTKDKACNMSMVFKHNEDKLDLVLFNRSNDLIYGGVCGANIVHFSIIHEAIAMAALKKQGTFYHVVCDAHVYVDNPHFPNINKFKAVNYPTTNQIPVGNTKGFDIDTQRFCQQLHEGSLIHPNYNTQFMNEIVVPMYDLWMKRNLKSKIDYPEYINAIKDTAWRIAVKNWLRRRHEEV